jgi:hypothetical protein
MSDNPHSRDSLSRTPSWVMLGFIIGCIVSLSVKKQIDSRGEPRPTSRAEAALAPTPTPTPTPEPRHATLAEMEAIFERWEDHAVWRNGITEVAFWDAATNRYSEYVEVLKSGDYYYFRNLSRLTRPLVEEGIPSDMPLRFTDPEARKRSIFGLPTS